MSEIRDRVEKDWAKVMSNIPTMRKSVDIGSLIEVLLAHQDVAIVDREAELPKLKSLTGEAPLAEKTVYLLGVTDMGEQVLKAGWIKEVKDE